MKLTLIFLLSFSGFLTSIFSCVGLFTKNSIVKKAPIRNGMLIQSTKNEPATESTLLLSRELLQSNTMREFEINRTIILEVSYL